MYDQIASLYHLVYEDWQLAMERQAASLDQLIREQLGVEKCRVLDVSCGIGTQSLGLAALGYEVTASDLSSGAVERARREALHRDLRMNISVADMRSCDVTHGSGFDVVLSADNSIPHLAGRAEVTKAVRAFFACLRAGGIAVAGVRDYRKDEDRASPQVFPYGFREFEGGRYFVFQTRDWHGDSYRVGMYFVREADGAGEAKVTAGLTTYYAIEINEVMEIFSSVGFKEVRRIDNVMHQPIVVGRRAY